MTCEHSASYIGNDNRIRCALCDLAAANDLLRKALRQIDRYREAMIEARDSLAGGEEEVAARLHLAMHERPYQGHSIEAHLSHCSQSDRGAYHER